MADKMELSYGMMFSFGYGADAVKFGEFTDEVVTYAKGLGDLARGIYYFTEGGGGRMSRIMTRHLLFYVYRAFVGDESIRVPAGIATKHKSPAYEKWKKEAFGWKPPRYLTGATARSLRVKYGVKGISTVGVSSTERAQQYKVWAKDEHGRGVKELRDRFPRITTYNKQLEFETTHYQLMGKAIRYWVREHAPEWSKVFDTYTDDFYNTVLNKALQRKHDKPKSKGLVEKGQKGDAADLTPADWASTSLSAEEEWVKKRGESASLKGTEMAETAVVLDSLNENVGAGGRDAKLSLLEQEFGITVDKSFKKAAKKELRGEAKGSVDSIIHTPLGGAHFDAKKAEKIATEWINKYDKNNGKK